MFLEKSVNRLIEQALFSEQAGILSGICKIEQALLRASRLEKNIFLCLRACSRNRETRVVEYCFGFGF